MYGKCIEFVNWVIWYKEGDILVYSYLKKFLIVFIGNFVGINKKNLVFIWKYIWYKVLRWFWRNEYIGLMLLSWEIY